LKTKINKKTLTPKLEKKRKGGKSKEKEKGKKYLGIKEQEHHAFNLNCINIEIESCNTQILINNNVERNEKFNGQ
jgi:hypothetical protein